MLQENLVDAMDHIKNAYTGLKRYFDTLALTGYYPRKHVQGLLMYLFIVDTILEGPWQEYIEDKDIGILNNVIKCLARDGCIIPTVINGIHPSKPRGRKLDGILRATETDLTRITEDDNTRITEDRNPF